MKTAAALCGLFILFLLPSCGTRHHCPAANDPKVTKLPKEGNLFTVGHQSAASRQKGDAFSSPSRRHRSKETGDAFSSKPEKKKSTNEADAFASKEEKKKKNKANGDAFSSRERSKKRSKETDAFASAGKKESNLGDKANGKEPKDRKSLKDSQSKVRKMKKTQADEQLAQKEDNPMGTSEKKKRRNERYRRRKAKHPDLDLFPPGVLKQ